MAVTLQLQAVRRIQATANFRRKAADAAAAYHRQRQQATAAVELVRCRYSLAAGQAFQWMHRPNVQQVLVVQLPYVAPAGEG